MVRGGVGVVFGLDWSGAGVSLNTSGRCEIQVAPAPRELRNQGLIVEVADWNIGSSPDRTSNLSQDSDNLLGTSVILEPGLR